MVRVERVHPTWVHVHARIPGLVTVSAVGAVVWFAVFATAFVTTNAWGIQPSSSTDRISERTLNRREWMQDFVHACVVRSTVTVVTAALVVLSPEESRAVALEATSRDAPTGSSPWSSTTLSSASSVSSQNKIDAATASSWTEIKAPIRDATDTLTKLVQNWERAVVDCTYADVPRELLEQRNKQLLLEKASTFALFDKSVSIVSCKTVVSNVRDYLGRTGIGPVAKLDASLQAAVTKLVRDESLDVDQVETILGLVREIQQTLIRADSLSYAARRDYPSLNNFEPTLATSLLADPGSNLYQCQRAIQTGIDGLQTLLKLLPS